MDITEKRDLTTTWDERKKLWHYWENSSTWPKNKNFTLIMGTFTQKVMQKK